MQHERGADEAVCAREPGQSLPAETVPEGITAAKLSNLPEDQQTFRAQVIFILAQMQRLQRSFVGGPPQSCSLLVASAFPCPPSCVPALCLVRTEAWIRARRARGPGTGSPEQTLHGAQCVSRAILVSRGRTSTHSGYHACGPPGRSKR
jgi:hypothetical protein